MTILAEIGATADTPSYLDANQIMTPVEAAAYLKFSKFTLDRLRVIGGGPRYAKLSGGRGGGSVRYRRADLDEWVSSRLVSSTSQTAA